MKTFVATKNHGKLDELRAIFAGSPLELDVYAAYESAAEEAATYAGNAASKARALHAQLRDANIEAAVLADDSGLEVEALGGRPGVLSARYAGAGAAWAQKRALLLEEMRGVPEERRGARFCCALVLIAADGRIFEGWGSVEGRIAQHELGAGGFGYDPIFYVPAERASFAQLGTERKNRISHRAHAARALLRALAHG